MVAEGGALGFLDRAPASRSRPDLRQSRARLPSIIRRSRQGRHQESSSTGPSPLRPTAIRWSARSAGLRNYWVACGVMAGFSQGGGVGLALANWMADGDPGFDIWAMDVARYGGWADMAYTDQKVRENYGRRFRITFPNEELPAARPLRTSPLYDRFKAMGAFFGVELRPRTGPCGSRPRARSRWRRSRSAAPTPSPIVGDECRAVRNGVGMFEITGYAKYEITGARRRDVALLHPRQPHAARRASSRSDAHAECMRASSSAISPSPRLRDERFYIFGSGAAEELSHALVGRRSCLRTAASRCGR